MTKDKDYFAHLHIHGDGSQLDGCGKVEDYVKEAAKRGNPAMAITDHGTCRSILKLHEACKETSVKPIFGSEFYVSKDMHRKGLTDEEKKDITKGLPKSEHRAAIKKYEDENGIRDRWHTTILAQNEVGLRNLYRLSSNSFLEGYYYKPRIDLDELEKYKEGLIVTTGCLSSPVNDSILQGRERDAFELADRLYDIAGENLYIELQPHAIRDQRVANKWAIDNLYERYDKKVRFLATQDAHYLNQADAEHHEVLLCIGTGSLMSDPDRFKFDGDEFHMRTRKEMFNAFRKHHEYIPKSIVTQALDSTLEVAARCDAKIHVDYKAALLPAPYRPEEYASDFEYLKALCLDGWKWRNIEKRARDLAVKRGVEFAPLYREYADRLKHELKALVAQKFVPYFLIIHEIYKFARSSNIMVGPGRGSAGGSLVAYLIGVTAVDPIEHGLYFERFISPFRYDLPDCLPPGVVIQTARGEVPVEKIQPGDFVLNRDGYRLVEKVHERWHAGEMLTLSDGVSDVQLTPNHKVVMADGGKLEAKYVHGVGLRSLQKQIHSQVEQPEVLQQSVQLAIDLEHNQEVHGVPKGIQRPEEAEGLRQGVRLRVECAETLLGQRWSTSGFASHGPVYFGGGFRASFDSTGLGVQVRARQDSVERNHVVHAGLLPGSDGEVRGVEGVARTRCGKIETGSLDSGREAACDLPSGFDSLDEKTLLDEWNGDVRKSEWDGEVSEDLREMQQAFRSNEREALLLFGVCEIDQSRSEVRESWSTRQDGTAMRHLWLGDEYLAERRQQEVLFTPLQEQGVCGQTKLFLKHKEAYSGPVYDLTINGRHEFFANGILVKNCDMDFEDKRRHEIVEWLVNRFGRDRVSQIATIGKLSGKSCIKDVSRVLGVPLSEVNKVTSSIIERSSGDERASQTIEDSFKDFEVCKQFNAKYPKVLHHAKHLENLNKTLGIHAAGVVTSPVPLADLMPMEIRKHAGQDVIVTAYDMYGVAAMGLAKLDVLGLRTLTVIREAKEAIKEYHGVDIDFEAAEFDMNDPKVLKAFTDHDYGGVFQYDTPSADKVCTGVEFTSFDDVAAMTALNRPGTSRSGLATKYVERKKNPKLVEKVDFHPKVSEITKDTLGIMVYQEHVIKIFVELAGFAPGNADSLRKVIAKKIGSETLGKERETFIEGCAKTSGVDAPTANKIMDAITFFGCLREDSLIATQNGPRKISDLKVGDEIISLPITETNVRCEHAKAIQRTEASERQDSAQANWQQACRLSIEQGCGQVGLHRDQDSSWQMGTGAQSDNGEDCRTQVDTFGHCPPCGRQRPEQHAGQPGASHTFNAHDTAQEGLQGPAVHSERLRQTGILQTHVPSVLPSLVQSEADSVGYGGRRDECQGVDRRVALGQEERTGTRESAACTCVKVAPSIEMQRGRMHGESCVQGHVPSSLHEGKTFVNRIKAIGPSGVKRCLRIELVDGGSVTCSLGHWWSTPSGWVKTRELRPGHSIVTPSGSIAIASIWDAGEHETWDLECEYRGEDGELANYLVSDGHGQWLKSHNSYGFNRSHAVEYGTISYWTMYLKVYYPLEFYWALLKNEPDRIRIAQYAKQAKKHGIDLLPPHVNISKTDFVIDRKHNAIRGSLVDIKGVGPGAADTIMEHQPFKDWFDMQDRVNKAKMHKGVNIALAKSGALKGLVPSTKWFLDNIEDIWKIKEKKRQRKELEARFEAAKGAEDYNDEDMALISSSVNPLAFGKHPIDAYKEFIERAIKFKAADMSSDSFFEDHGEKGTWIQGVILEVKYNQIGDFHTGAAPTEEEKRDMFWGARYANVNIEDAGGKQNRCKFDIDIFDEFRPVIDAGIGTPVMAHVIPNSKFQNLRAQMVVNLATLRDGMKSGRALSVWERIVTGTHPALSYEWKDKETRHKRVWNTAFKASPVGGTYVGVVTNVRLKYDRNGNLMAFFGLMAADGDFIDVIAFASNWEYVAKAIKQGYLVKCLIEKKPDRTRGWSYFCGERVKVLWKPSKHESSE